MDYIAISYLEETMQDRPFMSAASRTWLPEGM
jgi:hypothetical protein